MDQMGTVPALHATHRLLDFADIKLIVVLGLAGAVSDDLAIGDVVIAAEVNEFQANSKAQATSGGYEVQYSGRHWPLAFRIREAISHFEFAGPSAFAKWQTETALDYTKLTIPEKESVCSSPSSLHLGPIASGNVVAASSAFVAEVKRIDRKFVAIDMEAAGVALAAAERIYPLPCLVVRGIADHADEGKKILDQQGKGAWRGYCVRSATSLLRNLLTWDGFLSAAELPTSMKPTADDGVPCDLVVRLKSCIGGPWLVGVTFGFYFHGPQIGLGGEVAPMDLTLLRISDTRVGNLLDQADEENARLSVHRNVQVAADRFAALTDAYRKQLNSADAVALLQDFDRVVTDILCPEREDDVVNSLLLESERLEEEIGADAVIELLRVPATRNARLRERFVDALANMKMWSEVLEALASVERVQLSRRELEHGLFACVKTGSTDKATEMMREHTKQYSDNAARFFREEVRRLHPQSEKEGL
jgi:nucleoside phosphorylase